jgi:hypothetical protein
MKCGVFKVVDIMVRTKIFNIYVDEQACVVKNNVVVHNIDRWPKSIQGFQISTRFPLINHMHPSNSSKWVPNVILSWVVGQQISFAMEALMQDEINKTSSHIELLD